VKSDRRTVTLGKIYIICLFLVANAMQRPSRRRRLATTGGAVTAGLAGCPRARTRSKSAVIRTAVSHCRIHRTVACG
jgi:hypothetical protein